MKKELSVFLVTDTHYYSPQLGLEGEAFERRKAEDLVVLPESGPIIDAAFDYMIADASVEIVLIPGDLINNGEFVCHQEFLEKLERLRAAGKRVFVTTATHDFTGDDRYQNCFTAEGFEDDHRVPVRGTKREELPFLYADYGFNQAYAVHRSSMSYAVKLADGYRMLALNDDGNGRSFCGYGPDCMAWILEQVRAAREAGDFIFAMTHHPILPPVSFYPMMSKRDMLGDYETVWETFADAGLQFFFTGHTHMHDISMRDTAKGNRLYDIATAALVGYPGPIRRIVFDEKQVRVTTQTAPSFAWEGEQVPLAPFLQTHFESLFRRAISAAADEDFDTLADIAGGVSIPREAIEENASMISMVGNMLDEITVGELSMLTGSAAPVDRVADVPVKELLVSMMRSIYGGGMGYPPDSQEYGAVMGMLAQLRPTLAKFGMQLPAQHPLLDALPGLLGEALYDAPPDDNNAVLEILPLRAQ